MEKITIPKGDEGFKLEFTVKDSDGDPVNLTGYTAVNIKMWAPGVPGTLLLDQACDNAAANGTCDYTVDEDDFPDGTYPAVGRYHAELELTSAGVVESTETFGITIMESG